MAKEFMKHPFVQFLINNWIGGLAGLMIVPILVTKFGIGVLESVMMSFTIPGFGLTLSAAGYLVGAWIQSKWFK